MLKIEMIDAENKSQNSIKLEYMSQDCVALTDDLIVISGNVVYRGRQMIYRVVILNLITGKEKELIAVFRDSKKSSANIEHKGYMIGCSFP